MVRLPSTKRFFPEHNLDPASVAAEFHSLVEQIATQLRTADGLALDQIQIHSPFPEKMKYNLYSALLIITAHNHRHLSWISPDGALAPWPNASVSKAKKSFAMRVSISAFLYA